MSDKTIIIGDIHLGKGFSIGKSFYNGALNSRLIDQINLLNWILSCGIERNVSKFIITGDIFEELKPESQMMVLFIEWIKNCGEYGIDVHIICGNHDLKRVGNKYTSVLDIIKASEIHNVIVHNQITTLNSDGVSYVLMPFRDKRALSSNSPDEAINILDNSVFYEKTCIPAGNDKVLIGHLAVEGAFYVDEIDNISNELMLPVSFFDGFDYVWLGHVHKPQVLSKTPRVAHIGSMDISDFGETKHKKLIVFYDPESENKFEEIILPTRPLRIIKAEVPKDSDPTEFVLNKINRVHDKYSVDNSIVKLDIKILDSDSVGLNREQITERLFELGAYHISHFSESKSVFIIPEDKRHISDSAIKPKDAVKSYAEAYSFESNNDKDDFIKLCMDIITEVDLGQKE